MKIGDRVKLRRGVQDFRRLDAISYRTAVITGHLGDVGGGLLLDRTLGGCCCWNVAVL